MLPWNGFKWIESPTHLPLKITFTGTSTVKNTYLPSWLLAGLAQWNSMPLLAHKQFTLASAGIDTIRWALRTRITG